MDAARRGVFVSRHRPGDGLSELVRRDRWRGSHRVSDRRDPALGVVRDQRAQAPRQRGVNVVIGAPTECELPWRFVREGLREGDDCRTTPKRSTAGGHRRGSARRGSDRGGARGGVDERLRDRAGHVAVDLPGDRHHDRGTDHEHATRDDDRTADDNRAMPPSPAPGEDRLSSASRLGYAGLGPIKLGMAFDDAVAAAHVTVQAGPDVRHHALRRTRQRSLEHHRVGTLDDRHRDGVATGYPHHLRRRGGQHQRRRPAHVSRRRADGPSLVITGPDGHIIVFVFSGDDAMESMTLSTSQETLDVHAMR